MSRPLRIVYEGAWYHVMNRGAGRRTIFHSDTHRELFLALLGEITETFGIELHAYCLMDNHYHLLMQTPRANLSAAMRHLQGLYTQRYNRMAQTDGPLFRGRFKAILVDADHYLSHLSRYIHLNPVMAKITATAHAYRWSSYPAYLRQTPAPAWLYQGIVLGLFGSRNTRQRYQAFVEAGLDADLTAFYAKQHLEPILGTPEFCHWIARMRRDEAPDPEVPDAQWLRLRPTLHEIMRETAWHFGVEEATLYRHGKGRGNLPRAVAMALCRRPGGYPLKDIAQVIQVGSYSSVSAATRRLDERLREDGRLRKQVDDLAKKLFG